LPVTSLEAGCENKCASPYIGERFGENSVGGKWLIGAGLRIPLTLLGHGQGAVGGEIILLNCCKWLQIKRTFYQVGTHCITDGVISARMEVHGVAMLRLKQILRAIVREHA
jgi:hypothetical protein